METLDDLELRLAKSFLSLKEFLDYTHWHYVNFTKPFLDYLDDEVKPDFIVTEEL